MYLRHLEPSFISYALSFFVIATWWNTHHRLFSSLVRYDQTIVRLNTFFLLVISITPFLVSVLFTYAPSGWGPSTFSARLAVGLYGGVQALGGAALLATWRHATYRRQLVSPSLPDEWIRTTEANQFTAVAVFCASTALAFVSPQVAELVWIAMVIGPGRRLLRRTPPPRPGPPDRPAGPPPGSGSTR